MLKTLFLALGFTVACASHAEGTAASDLLCPVVEPQATATTLDTALYHQPLALPGPQVAIIIDDLGYRMEPGRQLVEIHPALTFAIIPFTPYDRRLAELAHSHGHEIMVHAPMETLTSRPWEPALAADMDRQSLTEMSRAMLSRVPYARGMNNHGGSLLTQRNEHMDWLMAELNRRDFYFIDSRTTADSVADAAAARARLEHRSRDVFLDNARSIEAIKRQLAKLEDLARRHGQALAIGHPYPETLTALREALPELERHGVRVVSVSTLISASKNPTKLARNTAYPPNQTAHP